MYQSVDTWAEETDVERENPRPPNKFYGENNVTQNNRSSTIRKFIFIALVAVLSLLALLAVNLHYENSEYQQNDLDDAADNTDLVDIATFHPTPFTSSNPTLAPTTSIISDFPTAIVNSTPSEFTTSEPSESPADFSTTTPSENPSGLFTTNEPSEAPSDLITTAPSEAPSEFLTTTPIENPSDLFTIAPSEAPSQFSTTIPSETLSNFQTEAPSAVVVASEINATLFQIQRIGYDLLPYFGENASSVVNYPFLASYNGVIEPYANMTLVYIGQESSTISFRYSVDKDKLVLYSGTFFANTLETIRDEDNAFAVECDPYDEFTLTLKVYEENTLKSKFSMNLVCIYVRREINAIPDDDLQTVMDAMYALWSTTDKGGKVLYGDDYHSSKYFAELHDFNAAWRDGDHIHEGLGFMPQHMKMTNLFEKSMQSVNPSVTLFYWDFTKESGLLTDSPMFQENTFGELNVPADSTIGWSYEKDDIFDAVIKNGRWFKTRAEGQPVYQDLISPYGYMRGPWNTNPSPYVSRFTLDKNNALPSCSAYYSWLKEEDFTEFMMVSENAPHGSTHGSIGGVYGCDMLTEMLDKGLIKDSSSQASICAKWGFYMKEMYRGNYLSTQSECETDATLDWNTTQCGFICNNDLYDDMLEMMQNTINLSDFVPSDMGDDGWESWHEFICSGNGYRIFVGDHLESASPSDPSFWPIHPTQERLLQLKYMVGGFEDYTWPTSASRDSTWVCNHAQCYLYYDLDKPKDYYDECCLGHYEYDQLLDYEDGDRTKQIGETNHDVLAAADPSGDYAMPYIYAEFSFDHCDNNFDKLIGEMAYAAAHRKKL